ncbi:hypothetical protein KR222_009720, partial [Zaprionus bogoriensis]
IMAEKYSSELFRVVIAQIAQTIGYSNSQCAPLELLEDILERFIQELAHNLHSQAEHANRAEPNLKDVFMSLRNLTIDVYELLDYIGNVEPVPFIREVPGYPQKRDSNMNFLKPGSLETLTRPIHIYDYLPPILPVKSISVCSGRSNHDQGPESTLEGVHNSSVMLLEEILTDNSISNWCSHDDESIQLNTSSRDNIGSESLMIREISSVVMTTGGFISPAIEGKLPESSVPDIIDKLKGLDAPPNTPPPEVPEIIKIVSKWDISVDQPIDKKDTILHGREECIYNGPSDAKLEQSIGIYNEQSSTLANTKIAKKNKKKHLLEQRKDLSFEDYSSYKAQEKSHRKAIKMFQKLSKTQSEHDSSVLSIKKSMKNLNRDHVKILSDTPTEHKQLEKLIKKQTKQRQKQKQQQRQHQPITKSISADCRTLFADKSIELTLDSGLNPDTSPIPVVGSSVDQTAKDNFDSHLAIADTKDKFIIEMEITKAGVNDEIKLTNEPDQSKLNIFKKISKQKAIKSQFPNTINMATNLFGNTNNSSSLINLPSGTTITPAPVFDDNVNIPPHMTAMNTIPTIDDPDSSSASLSPLCDIEKPKKRGRKPGGKNQAKSRLLLVNTPKKLKTTNLSNSSPLPNNVPSLPLPIGPINSHIDYFKHTSVKKSSSNVEVDVSADKLLGTESKTCTANVKYQKVKEKKDKKKVKRNDNFQTNDNQLTNNKKFSSMVTGIENQCSQKQRTVVDHIGSSIKSSQINEAKGCIKKGLYDDVLPSLEVQRYIGGLGSETNITNTNIMLPITQPNIIPMLPLLHFPPRPGLIPSGIFPPTSLTNFPNKNSNMAPNNLMPNPFTTFPTTSLSASDGNKSFLTEKTENQSTRLSDLDTHLDRSYCNVAPLVPESMKLTTVQIDNRKTESDEKPAPEIMKKNKGYISQQKSDPQSEKSAKMIIVSTGTGNLGDPIEVSDDSNDTELNMIPNKELPSIYELKSNKIQPSKFFNPDIEHHTMNPQPIITNPSSISSFADYKQFQKMTNSASGSLKVNQPDKNNLVVDAPPFNISYMGNDKFSLAGGADLIPLSRIDSGLAYSSQTVPATSLTAGSSTGSITSYVMSKTEESNFVSNFIGSVNYDDVTITPTNSMTVNDITMMKHKKIKKTKDGKIKKKKDKKDKTRNKFKKDEKNILKIEKCQSPDKKVRKKKTKLVSCYAPQSAGVYLDPMLVTDTFSTTVPQIALNHHLQLTQQDLSTNQVPKLTLKLGEKSTLHPTSFDGEEPNSELINSTALTPTKIKREHSPELARFSPLVTGPPKPKQCNSLYIIFNTNSIPIVIPSNLAITSPWKPSSGGNVTASAVSATLSASSVLLPQQLMQTSSQSSVPQLQTKGLQLLNQSTELNRPSSYVDAEGYRIWICPACGKVDDGSAMIGCDGCDAWYHWICVGILVAPNDNEDWFCRVCMAKKKTHGLEKKKKRNKRK